MPWLRIIVAVLAADWSAHVRSGLVAGIADANLAVVDRRAFIDDGANIFHRRRMINQDIEGGIGVIEIFDDQGVAFFARAADEVALFGIMAILDADVR